MSPRSFVAVVTALLVLAGATPAVALAEAPSGSGSGATADASGVAQNALSHNDSLAPGEVEMRIDVAAGGDARWRVKTVITDDADPDSFADLVEQFNQSESPLGLDGYRAAAENASQASGRQMEIRNVERHHALHNGTGVLWITFTWTNFARTSGDRLSIDDGFNTSSGVWLPSLSESETLVVAPPDGYGVSSAPTGSRAAPSSLSGGVARWEGPLDFGQRGPWIVYSGDAPTPTPTPTIAPPNGTGSPGGPGAGTSPGGPGGDGDGLLSGALPLIVLIVLVGVIAAVLAVYMRSGDGGLGALVGSDGSDDGTNAETITESASENGDSASADAATGERTGAPENGSEPGGATVGAAGATAAGAGASASDGTDSSAAESNQDADDEIDEELLSDEERVERLIERNGGRMKQAAIVQETGWSNAKVSQLLSSMDDDGRINKLRIGRENLISFPDEDVADLDSE